MQPGRYKCSQGALYKRSLGAINAARERVEPAVLPQLGAINTAGAINAARERVEPAVLLQLGANYTYHTWAVYCLRCTLRGMLHMV